MRFVNLLLLLFIIKTSLTVCEVLGKKQLNDLITDNVIKENQWGGVDIRRGGDPILRNNFICHGYSDGVVVGERGRGLIEGNHVYCA